MIELGGLKLRHLSDPRLFVRRLCASADSRVFLQALRLLLHDAEPRISCSFLVLWPRRYQSSLLWPHCELRWLVLR